MFVQMRKMVVTEGNAEKVVERFGGKGVIERQEGFIDASVMVKKARHDGDQEVVVVIRWESEEHWRQWEKSDAHVAGHKANQGKPKPEYIVSLEAGLYDVKTIKKQ